MIVSTRRALPIAVISAVLAIFLASSAYAPIVFAFPGLDKLIEISDTIVIAEIEKQELAVINGDVYMNPKSDDGDQK